MKKYKAFFVILMFVLLTSCTKSREIEDVSAYYAVGRDFTATVEIFANGETTEGEWTAKITHGAESDLVTVTAPAELAGLSVTLTDGGNGVAWNGTAAAIPTTSDAPAPFSAVAMLANAWQNGWYASVCEDDGVITAEIHDPERDEGTYLCRFDGESMKPISAEIYENETMIVRVVFADFEIQG